MIGVLIAAAFTLSLFVSNTASPLLGATFFLFYAGCFLALFTGQHKFEKSAFNYLLIAWLLWVTLSALFIGITKQSALFWMILTLPVVYKFSMARSCVRVIPYIAVTLTILALSVCVRWLLDSGNHWWPFLNKNNLAAALNFGLVGFFAAGFKDKRYWYVIPVFALALFSVDCRTAYIAAVIGIGYLALKHSKKDWFEEIYFISALSILVIFLFYVINPDYVSHALRSVNERFELWRITWLMIVDRPFFGWGIGSFTEIYPQYLAIDQNININVADSITKISQNFDISETKARNVLLWDVFQVRNAGYFVHNTPLQFVMEMGFITGLLFYALCFSCNLSIESKAVLLTAVISTHTSYHFYMISIMILVAVCLQERHIET